MQRTLEAGHYAAFEIADYLDNEEGIAEYPSSAARARFQCAAKGVPARLHAPVRDYCRSHAHPQYANCGGGRVVAEA